MARLQQPFRAKTPSAPLAAAFHRCCKTKASSQKRDAPAMVVAVIYDLKPITNWLKCLKIWCASLLLHDCTHLLACVSGNSTYIHGKCMLLCLRVPYLSSGFLCIHSRYLLPNLFLFSLDTECKFRFILKSKRVDSAHWSLSLEVSTPLIAIIAIASIATQLHFHLQVFHLSQQLLSFSPAIDATSHRGRCPCDSISPQSL